MTDPICEVELPHAAGLMHVYAFKVKDRISANGWYMDSVYAFTITIEDNVLARTSLMDRVEFETFILPHRVNSNEYEEKLWEFTENLKELEIDEVFLASMRERALIQDLENKISELSV